MAWLLPLMVTRLFVGDLHTNAWGEGQWVMVVTIIRATWMKVALKYKCYRRMGIDDLKSIDVPK